MMSGSHKIGTKEMGVMWKVTNRQKGKTRKINKKRIKKVKEKERQGKHKKVRQHIQREKEQTYTKGELKTDGERKNRSKWREGERERNIIMITVTDNDRKNV